MKHKILYIAIIFFMLAGCAGVQINFDENRMAFNTGALVIDLARVYAPDYVPEIERVRDRALITLRDETVELGPVIGDIIAVIQTLAQDPDVDEYSQIIADACKILFDAITLDWDTPLEFERARGLVISFLGGMKQ